jgi:hypothetical protein
MEIVLLISTIPAPDDFPQKLPIPIGDAPVGIVQFRCIDHIVEGDLGTTATMSTGG